MTHEPQPIARDPDAEEVEALLERNRALAAALESLEQVVVGLRCELDELQSVNADLERGIEARERLHRLMRDVSALANRTPTVSEVVRGTLRNLCERGGWSLCHFYYYDVVTATLLPSNVWFPEWGTGDPFDELRTSSHTAHFVAGDTIVGEVFESGAAREAFDLPAAFGPARTGITAGGLCRALVVPVSAGSTCYGVLELFSDDTEPARPQFVHAMVMVAGEIGQAIQRKQTESLTAQIEATEQARIGQEVHDTLGQSVSGVSMLAHGLLAGLRSSDSPHLSAAEDLVAEIDRAKLELRRIVRGLTPVYSGAEGLPDALDRLVDESGQKWGVPCTFVATVDGVEDHFVARHLYFIAQEAVVNALKHSRPTQVSVRLDEVEGRIELTIRDDGSGIPAQGDAAGSGLRIMRHRAGLMAARLLVESEPGRGTLVRCRVRMGAAFRTGGDSGEIPPEI